MIPATTAARWGKVAEISTRYPGAFAAYGLHPMFMDEHDAAADPAALDAWLDTHDAVAVGECGLDFYRGDDDADAQLALFRAQLDIAAEEQPRVRSKPRPDRGRDRPDRGDRRRAQNQA